MVLVHRVVEGLGEDLREDDLPNRAEVAAGQFLVEGVDAHLDVLVAEEMPELPDHFLHADVGSGVAGAAVAGQEQLQRFAGFPLFARVQGVAAGGEFQRRGHGAHEGTVGIEPVFDLVFGRAKCVLEHAEEGLLVLGFDLLTQIVHEGTHLFPVLRENFGDVAAFARANPRRGRVNRLGSSWAPHANRVFAGLEGTCLLLLHALAPEEASFAGDPGFGGSGLAGKL